MTAAVQNSPEQESAVQNLREQILQKRQQERVNKEREERDAFQERKTGTVHVRTSSDSGEEMDEGSEGEGGANGKTQEKRNPFKFSKGEKNWDVDDDAEFEFVADKRPIKMTLKEMRDAAAGGVAVRNRLRQVAEERKALSEPFKDFSRVAKDDPLGALQKMFGAIQKIDPEADFNEFISDLARQAQTVAHMEPNARKAYQLEKDLKDRDERLSESEQLNRIAELKQELMADTGLPEHKVYEFGQHILNHPVLSKTVETEEDLMERIGDLAEEIEMQKASFEALRKYKPDLPPRDPLVFELSNLLKANPDFDEKDLEEIAAEVLGSVQKAKASQKLSKRQRSWTGTRDPESTPDFGRMKPVDALKWQIENKKKLQQQEQLSRKKI